MWIYVSQLPTRNFDMIHVSFQAQLIFGLDSKPKIFRGKDKKNEVTKETDLLSLNGSLLYVY